MQIFITGMYRSGTTLLHHLLDGHPQLNVFPVENPIFRDTLAYNKLPFPRERNILTLYDMINAGQLDYAVDYILSHEKLSLALSEDIVLNGSTGNQVVHSAFDKAIFISQIRASLSDFGFYDSVEEWAKALNSIYLNSYFLALGLTGDCLTKPVVNKCPEAGYLLEKYLQIYDDSKVIHIIRDPRAVVASLKAKLPRDLYHPFFRLFPQLALIKNSMTVSSSRYENRYIQIRYEDLVSIPETVLAEISQFLGIKYKASMLAPTILGVPWRSNSSNVSKKEEEFLINSAFLDKYKDKLNPIEIKTIEMNCAAEMETWNYEIGNYQHLKSKLLMDILYAIRSLFSIGTYIHKFRARLSRQSS